MLKRHVIVFLIYFTLFQIAGIAFADSRIEGGKIITINLEHDQIDGYTLWIPEGFDSLKKWPIIYSLHSAAEVGGKIERSLEHGPMSVIGREHATESLILRQQFLILSPHLKAGAYKTAQWYLYTEVLNQILAEITQKYSGDINRVYLIGYSTGGTGTWGYLSRFPEKFAAAIPICGYTQRGKKLKNIVPSFKSMKNVPIWIFHNVWDRVVPYRHSRYAAEDIEKVSGEKFIQLRHNIEKVSAKIDKIVIKEKDADILGKKRLFSSYNIYIHDHGNIFDSTFIYRWMLSHSRQ
jgi:predicted peptidase